MLSLLLAGAPPGAAILSHGRLQSVSKLPSLRHLCLHGLSARQQLGLQAAARAAPCFDPAAPPRPPRGRHGRRIAASCAAVEQLPEVGGASAVGAAARRTILPGEVHLWWLDPRKVCGEAELRRCSELLTPEELEYCDSSEEGAVRRERLLARALIRSVLANYLAGCPHPRALLFDRNSHGKPCLLGPAVATPDGHLVRFNLTHTPSMIGLAVTVEGMVGLDVEGLARRTRRDPMRLAHRRFSDHEIADLQACPDEASRAAYFLQLWTLKEAYVKALGRGISAPPGLRSFSFRVAQPPAGGQQQQEEPAAGGQPAGAVCLGGSDCEGDPQQEQRQPNVPPPQQQRNAQRPQRLLVRACDGRWHSVVSAGSSGGSGDSGDSIAITSSGSVDFHSSAPEPRRWQFALLQPAPGLVSALCIERGGDADSGSDADSLRLLCFDAAPWQDEGRLIEPQLLALGQYPA